MKGADYGYAFEGALLNRLRKYRRNYFHWIEDFSIPTTNSLSERSLRGVKSKMKVSGQFESVEYAQYYATLRSYVETCRIMIILIRAGGLLQSPGMEVVTLQHEALYPVNSNQNYPDKLNFLLTPHEAADIL